MTKKSMPDNIIWTSEANLAFSTLRDALTSSTVMRNPDYEQTFVLQTDASNIGIGAVMSQRKEDRPIAYYSRRLHDREQNYSTVEKGCLAAVLATKHFEVHLLGKPFIPLTDHKALKWLQDFKEKNSCLTRWSLSLQPFVFTVQHQKGTDNGNTGALS